MSKDKRELRRCLAVQNVKYFVIKFLCLVLEIYREGIEVVDCGKLRKKLLYHLT